MAAKKPSMGCIDAVDKRVLDVLFTKMSSEEVMGEKSLIFDIIGGEVEADSTLKCVSTTMAVENRPTAYQSDAIER